jgi:hypothetical protein|tara:strand:- start:213 stop:515 length:303 start_codon:yes stop_codon:yes gene_type:complete
MEVRVVRLSSGEELICKYETDGATSKIKNPAVLIPMQGGQLGMMGWMPYADYNVLEIDNKFIMFAIKPQIELMNQYNENLGNGLVVPEKKIASSNLTLST